MKLTDRRASKQEKINLFPFEKNKLFPFSQEKKFLFPNEKISFLSLSLFLLFTFWKTPGKDGKISHDLNFYSSLLCGTVSWIHQRTCALNGPFWISN